MEDYKLRGKIINALRKLTYTHSPRNQVKKNKKVAPATHECEGCGIWVYNGAKNVSELDIKPPKGLIKGSVYLDHIEPVIAVEGFPGGNWDWNIYISRLFCGTEGFQVLCKECHDKKTKEEDKLRKKYRQNKLTKKKQ